MPDRDAFRVPAVDLKLGADLLAVAVVFGWLLVGLLFAPSNPTALAIRVARRAFICYQLYNLHLIYKNSFVLPFYAPLSTAAVVCRPMPIWAVEERYLQLQSATESKSCVPFLKAMVCS